MNAVVIKMSWFQHKLENMIGRDYILNWNLPLSFCKYKCIGIRPAMALILIVGEIWKASSIQMETLYCISLSSLREYANSALL